MYEELKKKSFKKSLWGTITLIIIGIFLIVFTADSAFYAVAGYDNFVELTPDEIKNQTVTFDMTTNFGCYMEEYEVNTDTGRQRTTDLYYIVWTGDDYATDFRYMTVKVPASMESEMEAMADNTYNELLSDPITIHGKIRQLDDEEYEYFLEFFAEAGWSEEEIAEGTLPYYIDSYSSVAGNNITYIVLFLLGVLLVIWAISRIVRGKKGAFLNKLHQDILEAGYTESSIASDYNNAFSMRKNDVIKIGRLMIYHEVGSVVRAIPANKMMWAYMHTTTHRTNGIKTGTTYSVVIYADTKTGKTELTANNQDNAMEILSKINSMFPWVVVGYSDELAKTFNKNRPEFLNIRYNTCEHIAVEPGFEGFTGFENVAQ